MKRFPRGPAFAAALISVSAAPASAVELDVRTDGLDAGERVASAQILDDVQRLVPPGWSAGIDGPLRIEWHDGLPAHVEGRYRNGLVRLRRSLLRDWQARDASRPDDAATRAARAAVLHELAHAWDRSHKGGLSRDARLLDLAGWPATAIRRGRVGANDFRDRTPDAYELATPREFVAVNLEHFLLDPEYACRRPALHRYLVARTQAVMPRPNCAPPAFVQPSMEGAADPSPLLEIDPARIAGVDYLLAEPDAHPMSRWGHSMLRLVVCAPGRPRGPDCRLDIASHVVLSFRAFVDDLQISGWRGLTGAYPSRLFVLPMPQVIEEYTKVELRGLRSVPLRLSDDEIALLLEQAAQVHWSYDGRYRFVNRNCAVETWRLLHAGVPRLASASLTGLTPTGLLRRLQSAGVADGSMQSDPDAALRLGYRFDSQGAYYAELLDVVRASLPIGPQRVETWLDAPPASRARWIEQADLRAAAALLVLESAALRRAEARAADVLKRRLLHDDAQAIALRGDLRGSLALADRLTRPAALLADGGYGQPMPGERSVLRARLETDAAEWSSRSAELRNAGEALLSVGRRDALAASRDNVARLSARLRELAVTTRD